MRLQLSCRIVFGLFFIAQLKDVGSKQLQEDQLLALQLKVENLIEKIINFIQGYYQDIKNELKCIPDCVSEGLMETLKDSITCVEENEKDYNSGKIKRKIHSKNFLKCFTNAKKEIRDMMKSVDTTVDYCPDNVTEKTYQINVTTTFSKTFRINIKNGLEITKKEIELNKDTTHCFDGDSDCVEDSTEYSDESQPRDDRKHKHTPAGGKRQEGKLDEGQHKGINRNKNYDNDGDKQNNESTEDDDSNDNSTEKDGSDDHYDDNSTEKSIKKPTGGNRKGQHTKTESRKEDKSKKQDSDSDYSDVDNSDLRWSSTEESNDDSDDGTEQYHRRSNYQEGDSHSRRSEVGEEGSKIRENQPEYTIDTHPLGDDYYA